MTGSARAAGHRDPAPIAPAPEGNAIVFTIKFFFLAVAVIRFLCYCYHLSF